MKLLNISSEGIMQMITEVVMLYGLRFLITIVLLILGLWLAGRVGRLFYNMLEKREVDPSLRSFLKSVVSILLKLLVVISVLSYAGIPMTSFIAILGAAGLAVGLALSGTLQNFAGGVLILLIKPFKVGDFIEAQGFMGTVQEIQVFNTILKTPDSVEIVIPNGGLSTASVTNYSVHPSRRAQWVFGIAYGDSFQKAKGILEKILSEDERVLKEPEPLIFLSNLNDSSVDITVRAWARSSDFWPLNFDIHQKVYDAFNAEGINIPFPQMDVHLKKD